MIRNGNHFHATFCQQFRSGEYIKFMIKKYEERLKFQAPKFTPSATTTARTVTTKRPTLRGALVNLAGQYFFSIWKVN